MKVVPNFFQSISNVRWLTSSSQDECNVVDDDDDDDELDALVRYVVSRMNGHVSCCRQNNWPPITP